MEHSPGKQGVPMHSLRKSFVTCLLSFVTSTRVKSQELTPGPPPLGSKDGVP